LKKEARLDQGTMSPTFKPVDEVPCSFAWTPCH